MATEEIAYRRSRFSARLFADRLYTAGHGWLRREEGDLWRVAATGGTAQRLTSHPGQETYPAVSPDGKWLAYGSRFDE